MHYMRLKYFYCIIDYTIDDNADQESFYWKHFWIFFYYFTLKINKLREKYMFEFILSSTSML